MKQELQLSHMLMKNIKSYDYPSKKNIKHWMLMERSLNELIQKNNEVFFFF
jgi:hypothetical protein